VKIDKPIEGGLLDKHWNLLVTYYRFDFWWTNIEEIIKKDAGVNVGVVGDWGTGKTTFLRMIERQAKKEGYPVVFYEAWRYQHDPDILLSLLQVLAENLKYIDEVKNLPREVFGIKLDDMLENEDSVIEKLKNTLSNKFQNWSVNLTLTLPFASILPFVPSISIGVSSETGPYRHISTKAMNKIYKLLEKAARSIRDWKKGKPLILIVDDVDRLLSHRAFQLLEDLRFYFYINNVVVFMGINENVLSRHIAKYYAHISETEAQRFLEKIVNFKIRLPYSDVNKIHIESLINKTKDNGECWLIFFNYAIKKITKDKGLPHRVIINIANKVEERILDICEKLSQLKVLSKQVEYLYLIERLSYPFLEVMFPMKYFELGNKDLFSEVKGESLGIALPSATAFSSEVDDSIVNGLKYDDLTGVFVGLKSLVTQQEEKPEETQRKEQNETQIGRGTIECIRKLIISQCGEEKQ